ncbi:MAG TPA: phosphoesterase [bacterium]|nr:phosphoesterase [bacterium]
MGMNEEILVVPRAALLPRSVHGFTTEGAGEYLTRIRDHAIFRRRGDVEQDPSLKQIIPYLVVRHRDRLFLFQRTASGGEARLHGKVSIGVGGHVNRSDVEGADDVVEAGLRRELAEELVIGAAWRARLVGVLNDDTNPVGRVHFGLVHVVEVGSPSIAVRESDTLTGRLTDPAEARTLYERMETWSQLILDAADPMRL